jgi:hypothetical protein
MAQRNIIPTVVFIILIIIISVTLTNFWLTQPRPEETREGFTEEFLADTIPSIESLEQPTLEPEPDLNTSNPKIIRHVVTSWMFEKNVVYTDFGGLIKVFVQNNGTENLYVYRLGIQLSWRIDDYASLTTEGYPYVDVGVYINTSSKRYVGILYFPGPMRKGEYEYNILLWTYQQNTSDAWNDCGIQIGTTKTLEVKALPAAAEYERFYNLPHYYDKINDIVDPLSEPVIELSRELASEYSGPFNIYQVCNIFDYVHENIKYVSDPSNTENYWCRPDQTIEFGGDCEDFSTLLASMLISIGGAVRMYLTDSHAFVGLYIGNESEINQIISATHEFYHSNIPIFWLADNFGAWLILDTIGALYPGGLPLGAAPTMKQYTGGDQTFNWSWDFIDTKNLYIVDLKP